MFAPAAVAAFGAAVAVYNPPNAISVEQSATLPRPGLGVTYERAFGRHLSVAGTLEHEFSLRRYIHLPGLAERLGFRYWFGRALHGPMLEATFGLAQNVFLRQPQHARHAAQLGANVGYRLAIGRQWLIGLAIGARYVVPIADRGTICTRDFQCPSTRPGFAARFAIHVGWRFGSG